MYLDVLDEVFLVLLKVLNGMRTLAHPLGVASEPWKVSKNHFEGQ